MYSCIHTVCLAVALAPSCTIRPWTGLWQTLAVACATTEKHSCPVSTFAHFHWKAFPSQTCINHLRDVNSWVSLDCTTILLRQPWEELVPGDEHHGIDPNMLNSGHRDCSTKAVFLCTADKLQCWPMLARNGTYWRMLAFSFLHISFIGTIASVVLTTFSFANLRKTLMFFKRTGPLVLALARVRMN